MIKKHRRKRKMQNQGNSFIMVVATLAFLSVLVTAMLVAVAVIYKMKAYDINARDNFYYLEQAMDEIYAGVGADAMIHLNDAYDDTIEVLVYFDVTTQAYVTMKNEDANRILKNTYIKLVKDDPNYKDATAVQTHLETFISNLYDATSNAEGVQLSVGNVATTADDLTIQSLVLKREAVYSTINTKKAANGAVPAGETFVQTITTDLVIGKPEFDVNFNTIDSDLSDLYDFALVADKGVEIGNATTKVNITGSIYAAADFYNKDYNITDSNNPNYLPKSEKDGTAAKYAAVSSYKDTEARAASCNGKNEKSMYSGLYIDGAEVFISADRVIVPGTIAAFNSAELTVFGSNDSMYNSAEIWADGIVLGGYSLLEKAGSDDVKGSIVRMRADAFIADDLEINAEAADFALVGDYYGYNYASLDNRTYTDACVKANGGRTFVSAVASTIADGATLEGQAHYNSSAIIVNGQDSVLDLSSVQNMYIAGQAYIETSKVTKTSDKVIDADGKETSQAYEVTNKAGALEAVENKAYQYPDLDADNYTTNTADATDKTKNTTIQDYRTGEAISIKSNQLAYIPNWRVNDTEKGLYLSLPVELRNLDIFKNNWEDLSKIPIIKTVVSGKEYYFFDFSTEATTKAGLSQDVMNSFIEAYAEMFTLQEGETVSQGETYGLTNITDYDYFEVEMLKINTTYDETTKAPDVDSNGNYTNIFSNSAISVKNDTSFTIKAKSSSINPLLEAAYTINNNIVEQNKYIADDDKKRSDSISTSDKQDVELLSKNVTSRLQTQYKEVKWTLSSTSSNPNAVQDAHTMQESDITPINYFFYFNKLGDAWTDVTTVLNSGYKIWVCKDDVHVTADGFADGNVKGMVICRGDVTFDTDVKSFEGLIVSGSKIKVEQSMNIMANAEIIKTILRECDESQVQTGSRNYFAVCELFQQYQSIYKKDDDSGSIETESTKSISAVQFEDILSYDNWLKNVD
ncbi:MAG: hypothetical protein IJP29_04010 [Lachnospiraceae bacterium]|nr:hypothetical protein [Lachnospiraceae bacterium]